MTTNIKKAYIAGGCFWGMEELFRAQDGILDSEVGYMGGTELGPTYRNHTGHAEALELTYAPDIISYQKILDFFFRVHNPTTLNQQGNDRGDSYRSAIFYQNAEEKDQAEAFIKIVLSPDRWQDPVVTTLEEFEEFFAAENEHQDYLQKNINGYTCHYVRFGSYLDEK